MTYLTIHCRPVGGGFGCDMGDLPAPPAALSWILYGLALGGLILGLYALVTGRLLVRWGKLKEISTARATRIIGLSLLVESVVSLEVGRVVALLSNHIEPPHESELFVFPLLIVGALLQWLAFRIDRHPNPVRPPNAI
jgi:hypothetical protein